MGSLISYLKGKRQMLSQGIEVQNSSVSDSSCVDRINQTDMMGLDVIKNEIGELLFNQIIRETPSFFDDIPTRDLYLYPYFDGEKTTQRIMFHLAQKEICSREDLNIFMSISTKDVVGKIVASLRPFKTKLIKQFGDDKYNLDGIGTWLPMLKGHKFPETLSITQILQIEKDINENTYSKNRVLFPDLSLLNLVERDRSHTIHFDSSGLIYVKVMADDLWNVAKWYSPSTKISGNSIVLFKEKEVPLGIVLNPFDETIYKNHEHYEDLYTINASMPSVPPVENSSGIILDSYEISSSDHEKRETCIEFQTIGRMFTCSNPESWTSAQKFYKEDRKIFFMLNTAIKWAILMEDAIRNGFTIEQVAFPFLHELTLRDSQSTVEVVETIKDTELFKMASLIIPTWIYGEQLREYANSINTYGSKGHGVLESK